MKKNWMNTKRCSWFWREWSKKKMDWFSSSRNNWLWEIKL